MKTVAASSLSKMLTNYIAKYLEANAEKIHRFIVS